MCERDPEGDCDHCWYLGCKHCRNPQESKHLVKVDLSRPINLAEELDIDLCHLQSKEYLEKGISRPLELVDITVHCPNHDIALEVIEMFDQRYFPDEEYQEPDP